VARTRRAMTMKGKPWVRFQSAESALQGVTALDTIHRAQCIHYLKGSGLWLCLLLNLGNPRLEIKRVVNDPS
jgi:hypothetical protein